MTGPATTQAVRAGTATVGGAPVWPGLVAPAAQAALADEVRAVLAKAPARRLVTRWGQPLSVAMSAAGAFGWTSDRRGYRYAAAQADGCPWPPIPQPLLALWAALFPQARAPESLLVNLYGPSARMGLHQDRDEADLSQPVLSVSLGWDGRMRVGVGGRDARRSGPTESAWLRSGDVMALAGPSRLAFHGIDRVRPATAPAPDLTDLLPEGGRVNLTLRVVT